MQAKQSDSVSCFPEIVEDNLRGVSGRFFFFDESESMDDQIKIIAGGVQDCPAGYRKEYDENEYYSIEFVVSGKGSLILRDNLFQMCPGTVFFHGPNIPCVVENNSSENLKKYFVNFKVTNPDEWDWEAFLEKNNPAILDSHHWLAQTLKQIIECGSEKNEFSANACCMLVKYLISRVSKEGQQVPVTMGMARDSFEKVRQYIEDNCLEITRISEVSKACNMSPQHIPRLFKQFSDQSPSAFLMQLKMEHAVSMLNQGTYLIKEIADQVGFADQYYFSTRFKQIYGRSPTEFSQTNAPLVSVDRTHS